MKWNNKNKKYISLFVHDHGDDVVHEAQNDWMKPTKKLPSCQMEISVRSREKEKDGPSLLLLCYALTYISIRYYPYIRNCVKGYFVLWEDDELYRCSSNNQNQRLVEKQ